MLRNSASLGFSHHGVSTRARLEGPAARGSKNGGGNEDNNNAYEKVNCVLIKEEYGSVNDGWPHMIVGLPPVTPTISGGTLAAKAIC